MSEKLQYIKCVFLGINVLLISEVRSHVKSPSFLWLPRLGQLAAFHWDVLQAVWAHFTMQAKGAVSHWVERRFPFTTQWFIVWWSCEAESSHWWLRFTNQEYFPCRPLDFAVKWTQAEGGWWQLTLARYRATPKEADNTCKGSFSLKLKADLPHRSVRACVLKPLIRYASLDFLSLA